MFENLEMRDEAIQNEEVDRKDGIAAATAREDDLQSQIDTLDVYNKDKVASDFKKGQEDLNAESVLNLNKNFN